jgi:hypothetical protein
MPIKDRMAYLAYQREYGRTHRDKRKEAVRNAKRRADPVYAAAQVERKRRWRAANRDRHLRVCRAYDAKQLRENPQRRLSKNLRHCLRKALLGQTKGASIVSLLGCTLDQFRAYIESMFAPNMTWNNYGIRGWQIDHIRPLVSFDLSEARQVAEAFHYTNIQPLWASDNQRKYCKLHPETWPNNWRIATETVQG